MPRYFIDSSDGDHIDIDDDGFELPDERSARRTALKALPEMARDSILESDERVFSIIVRTADGRIIYAADLRLTGHWGGDDGSG